MKINSLQELAAHVDAAHQTIESVARRVYKDTTCGVSFYADEAGVILTGYCEGEVGECSPHRLKWGFTAEEWYDAMQLADEEGCDLWDQTHGCDECKTDEVDGLKPVDPSCSACGGSGTVI